MTRPSVLFLAHRIPYPPNKGDKIRSFHLLQHLASRYRVYLGAFVDDPADFTHADALDAYCQEKLLRPLSPKVAKVRSLTGLLRGQPLTVPYYRDRAMQAWVDEILAKQHIDRVLIFSGAMAQYVLTDRHRTLTKVVDFVDVDSDKWRQYAPRHRWPMSWLYRREGRKLLCFERRVASACDASLFVSPAEAELFRSLAPRQADRVAYAANGVDLAYFEPEACEANPYGGDLIPLVFTGAMDYWPNVDAVTWFVHQVLPRLRLTHPQVQFHIIGGGAGAEVEALADQPGVCLGGRVPDVRPWLQYAAVAVAPLRVARGVQNKVLEAMAMAKPAVVTQAALEGIDATPGDHLLVADDADDFAKAVARLIDDQAAADEMGQRARQRVEQAYQWNQNMARVSEALEGFTGERRP